MSKTERQETVETLSALLKDTPHLYVTDFSGNLIPNITVSATSGFDYLHPTPEPGAVGGLVAIGALVALRRRGRN